MGEREEREERERDRREGKDEMKNIRRQTREGVSTSQTATIMLPIPSSLYRPHTNNACSLTAFLTTCKMPDARLSPSLPGLAAAAGGESTCWSLSISSMSANGTVCGAGWRALPREESAGVPEKAVTRTAAFLPLTQEHDGFQTGRLKTALRSSVSLLFASVYDDRGGRTHSER